MNFDVPYYQEILNFTQSLCIKFTPIANIIGNNYMEAHGLTTLDDSANPYYMHMLGEYSPDDEDIIITSVDTGTEIVFNKTNLAKHPKTKQAYSLPNTAFYDLIEQYPLLSDLIRGILYPVESIHKIVDAGDIALLNYDESLVHSNEINSFRQALIDYLAYVAKRWYISSFEIENLYPIAFTYILWNQIPLILHAQRVRNIKTNNVHPFHIWEYLISKGLGDYRAILNNEQALFLYRNIDYILSNQGKQQTLQILAENLLGNLQVDLVGKYLIENTKDTVNTCRMLPLVVSKSISNETSTIYDSVNSSQTDLAVLINRLTRESLDEEYSSDELVAMTKSYGEVTSSTYLTKFVEIAKNLVDTRYETLMNEFALNSLLYRISKNKITAAITLTEEVSGRNIIIDLKEAVALFNYLFWKSESATPTIIPTVFDCRLSWKIIQPELNLIFYVNNHSEDIRNHTDYDTIINMLSFNDNSLASIKTFMNLTETQFEAFHFIISGLRTTGSTLTKLAYNTLYQQLVDNTKLTIPYPADNCTTYDLWFTERGDIKSLFETMEDYADKEASYSSLLTQLIEKLFPFSTDFLAKYGDISSLSSTQYSKLKELFVKLCSYNIAFLDTEGTDRLYVYLNHITSYIQDTKVTKSDIILCPNIDMTEEPYSFKEFPLEQHMEINLESGGTFGNTSNFVIDFNWISCEKKTSDSLMLSSLDVNFNAESVRTYVPDLKVYNYIKPSITYIEE